jgi:hypothetical protein
LPREALFYAKNGREANPESALARTRVQRVSRRREAHWFQPA